MPDRFKQWMPSLGEQRLLWWSRLVMRWIGCAGIVYSTVTQNAIGLLVFGALGSGMDVGTLSLSLFRAVRQEAREIEDRIDRYPLDGRKD